jgi:hypothetical protein
VDGRVLGGRLGVRAVGCVGRCRLGVAVLVLRCCGSYGGCRVSFLVGFMVSLCGRLGVCWGVGIIGCGVVRVFTLFWSGRGVQCVDVGGRGCLF